jgi:hypothetical protein
LLCYGELNNGINAGLPKGENLVSRALSRELDVRLRRNLPEDLLFVQIDEFVDQALLVAALTGALFV